jgi:hypothetical protein
MIMYDIQKKGQEYDFPKLQCVSSGNMLWIICSSSIRHLTRKLAYRYIKFVLRHLTCMSSLKLIKIAWKLNMQFAVYDKVHGWKYSWFIFYTLSELYYGTYKIKNHMGIG